MGALMRLAELGSRIFSWMGIKGSAVSGEHSAVLVGGEGACGGFSEDSPGETASDCEAYGALGIVVRPRPPESVTTSDGTTELQAEAIGYRTSDGITPLAWRDLRLNRAFPAPKSGSVTLVGYAGGFIGMEDSEESPTAAVSTVITVYCPYARPTREGVPAKAHCIILDPVNEDVKIIQGDGSRVLLTKTGVIIGSPDGSNRIEITNAGIKIVGNFTQVGTAIVGLPPTSVLPVGLPVLCGAPPGVPSTSLLVGS